METFEGTQRKRDSKFRVRPKTAGAVPSSRDRRAMGDDLPDKEELEVCTGNKSNRKIGFHGRL